MARRRKLIIPSAGNTLLLTKELPLLEQFKGAVQRNEIQFPKEIGEEHPFSFEMAEKVYLKNGLAKAAVDKHLDFIMAPGFYVTSKDGKAETLINDFIMKSDFEHHLREFLRESLIKGNGFMEIGLDQNDLQIKTINANNMYVKRDKVGKITEYNQFIGDMGNIKTNDIITFTPDEIAHLKLDPSGDNAYGFGMIFPAVRWVDNLNSSEKDLHLLMKRKANSPIIATVGTEERPATQDEVDKIGERFEYLNNFHEWSFSHEVKVEVLDFGNFSEKFVPVLEHDSQMLFKVWQVPAVIMGMANIPEGLAKVQMDTFERRIQSIQAAAERIIEMHIFKPILNLNGLDSHVEMHWGQPSETKINERVQRLTEIMKNPLLSPGLRAAIEIDIANQLGYDDAVSVLPTPAKAIEDFETEKEMEFELEQPEVPGEKPNAKQSAQIPLTESNMTLKEWLNFDYKKYQFTVLAFIKKDGFDSLTGKTTEDFHLGMLTPQQSKELKNIFLEGFEKNSTLNEISKKIEKMGLKDRLILKEGEKILKLKAIDRPSIIARTESTRLAAEGVLTHYQKQGIQEVRWLASVSERTCPICLANNGTILQLNEARNQIPAHVGCRCSWVGI